MLIQRVAVGAKHLVGHRIKRFFCQVFLASTALKMMSVIITGKSDEKAKLQKRKKPIGNAQARFRCIHFITADITNESSLRPSRLVRARESELHRCRWGSSW